VKKKERVKHPWDFRSYQAFLLSRLKGPEAGRGALTRFASAVGCQPGYLTRVIQEVADLSLEQAERGAIHLGLEGFEAEIFLLMVGKERAGTPSLKKYFERKIEDLRNEASDLKTITRQASRLEEREAEEFYEDWVRIAVYVGLSIPSLRHESTLASTLALPAPRVRKALQWLQRYGLIESTSGRLRPTRKQIHLPQGKRGLDRHHANWRLKAIASLGELAPHNLHYTSVVSCSRKDQGEVRRILSEAVERVRALVADSPEEAIMCYSVDLFNVSHEQ